MSGDLVSLRMLVIAAAKSDQELWRRGTALSPVPIEFAACDAASAVAMVTNSGADICVVDYSLPDADKTAVIKAAHAKQPAPLIFVYAPNGSARPEGINGMLGRPLNVEDARKLAEICVRAKVPTRVLIVDDSGTMRSIVRKILQASRYTLDIAEANEGIAALNHLGSQKVDLVLLDYNMPGFNGFETLAEIKRVAPHVAVVMMTSTVDDVIRARAESSGAAGFLKKPFYPADIDAILDRIYDRR